MNVYSGAFVDELSKIAQASYYMKNLKTLGPRAGLLRRAAYQAHQLRAPAALAGIEGAHGALVGGALGAMTAEEGEMGAGVRRGALLGGAAGAAQGAVTGNKVRKLTQLLAEKKRVDPATIKLKEMFTHGVAKDPKRTAGLLGYLAPKWGAPSKVIGGIAGGTSTYFGKDRGEE